MKKNKIMSRKAISPVVATALLLVVAVVAVIGFNNWYSTYSSEMFSDMEEDSSSDFGAVGVETVIGDQLYVKNGNLDNLSIAKILVDGEICYENISIESGISNLSLSSCLGNVSTATPQITIMTEEAIIRESIYLEDINLIASSEIPLGSSFISIWNTSIDAGFGSVSAVNQIRLPLQSDGSYNFLVDWGNGTTDTITAYDQAEVLHTYPTPGVYIVNITGLIDGFAFNAGEFWDDDLDDGDKLIEIQQWGSLKLGNNGEYFAGCDNFNVVAIDDLDLSGTTNLSFMFANARDFNADISGWDMSSVTNMTYMFYWANSFNQTLSSWDTSSVTDMSGLFNAASSFNNNVSGWDVSSVTNMYRTFYLATKFNGNVSNWDVSSVTNMGDMFNGGDIFNQSLNSWDVSSVKDMNNMFRNTDVFNQNLSEWNVSSVVNMNGIFGYSLIFNGSISSWDVSSVDSMYGMFQGTTTFNQDLSSWNVSSVTTMHSIFNNAIVFNQDLSLWDVSSVSIYTNYDTGANAWLVGNKPVFS